MSTDVEAILDSAKPGSPVPRFGQRSLARRLIGRREVHLSILIVVFILVVSRFAPYFFYPANNFANFRVMFVGMAMETIVLAAMVYLLVGGMFDLSVDGTVNMSGVITGMLLLKGADVWVAVLAGLGSAALVGLINGVAVTKLRMNPLITTLGMWWITQGLAEGITQGVPSSTFPQLFKDLGYAQPLDITMPIWYAVVLVPLAIGVLAWTKFGYHVYATGGNRLAARLHGVNVDRVTIISFVLVSLAGAMTGLVYAARLNSASPQTVNGLNLRVIAAAVIGGCSLTGGEGNIFGALLGLFFMTMLSNASISMGVSPYFQRSILGAVLLAAVLWDALTKRGYIDRLRRMLRARQS